MPVEVFPLEKLPGSDATPDAANLRKLFYDMVDRKEDLLFDTPYKRSELFFGHVLGEKKRRVKADDKLYTANRIPYQNSDIKRPNPKANITSYDSVEAVFEPVRQHYDLIYQICANAVSKLTQASKSKGASYLQCNVNLYSGQEAMSWHRDDGMDREMRPLENTFYPASATLVLLSDGVTEHQGFGLQVHAPIEEQVRDYSDLPGIHYHKERKDELVFPPALGPCELVTSDSFGKLIVLSGSAYTHGVHTAGIGQIPEGEEFVRMSWNFRLVKKDAWKALKGDLADLHPWATPVISPSRMAIAAE